MFILLQALYKGSVQPKQCGWPHQAPSGNLHSTCQPQVTSSFDLHLSICVSSPQFSSVQSLSCVQLFATPWTAAHQASLTTTNSRSLLKLMSIESVIPSNHLIPCRTRPCLQSFPASESFPISQFFTSGGQRIGVAASVSVLPMNI